MKKSEIEHYRNKLDKKLKELSRNTRKKKHVVFEKGLDDDGRNLIPMKERNIYDIFKSTSHFDRFYYLSVFDY